jgi:hypothetical protein
MLRRQADRILINTINPATIHVVSAGVQVDIDGYGSLTFANQISSHKSCKAAEVLEVVDVDVAIPTSCECPYEWTLTIECLPNYKTYETSTTFPKKVTYGYEDPAGGTPTAAATAAAIAAQINADPYACVTATVVGTTITLTMKPGTFGFNAYTPSGTVTVTTAYTPPVLSDEYMARLFPIRPGSFGSQPNLPVAGDSYCEFHFVIRNPDDIQDVDGANHWNGYEKEVYFYVRSTDPNYAAFNAALAALILIANGGTHV